MFNPVESSSITPPFTPKACHTCAKTPDKLLTCAQCHFEKNCSSSCQKKDWPTHKKVCRKSQHPKTAWANLLSKKDTWKGDVDQPLKSDNLVKKVLKPELENLRGLWDFFSEDASKQKEKTSSEAKVTTFTQDLSAFAFPSKEFDLVVANDIFQYEDPAQLSTRLTQIHSCLKGGGALIGSFFTRPEKTEHPMLYQLQVDMGAWFVDDAEMANALILSSGFDCIKIQNRTDQSALEFFAIKRDTPTT